MPNASSTNVPAHTWRFFRAGGFNQVRLETGADLVHLDQLDQKLWVALACPTSGLEFDPKTLALIDTDADGRIRAPELIAAVKWAASLLKDPDVLVRGSDSLPIDAINDATDEGRQLAASARQILSNLGSADAKSISLAEASDANKIFANTTFNGDGVIIPESASDEKTRAVIQDVMACVGTSPDRSGKQGINQAQADEFFNACVAFDQWTSQSEKDATTLLPAGPATAAASAAVKAIKAKVDDYFGRCRIAEFDSRALAILNRKEEEYLEVAAADLSISASEVSQFPLARIAAKCPLPLSAGVNPAHAAAVAALLTDAIRPLLGERTELTEAEWAQLQRKLEPYDSWLSSKAGGIVEKLGIQRVREILASDSQKNVNDLIARDKSLEPEANAIASVEKVLLYVRDLHRLCVNFVNFKDLYDGGEPAIFQAGILYLDQRSCHLCLPVDDAARHASMAALAGTYLAYCDCVRKSTGEKRQIVAAFTNGDSDNLMVGRNGLFYDRKNRDWDATITKIVDNPISIRQAFWAPYKKLVRLIEEQVAKRAGAAEAASDTRISAAATTVATADKAKTEPKKVDVGTVAALGVAFAALTTAVAALAGYFSGLLKLPFWQLCLALVALLLVISGPSMIIAWLKLRKRNLGPIMDANGWAVNAKARINVAFGASLTQIAKLPPGSVPPGTDRFGDRPSVLPKLALFVIIVCFVLSLLNDFGLIHQWTQGKYGSPRKEKTEPKPGSTNSAPSSATAPQ